MFQSTIEAGPKSLLAENLSIFNHQVDIKDPDISHSDLIQTLVEARYRAFVYQDPHKLWN